MRSPAPVAVGVLAVLALAGCTAAGDAEPTALATAGAASSSASGRSGGTAPSASSLALASVRVGAAAGTTAGAATGHELQVPAGWSAAVWAHVDGARMAVWTPDGRLLMTDGGGAVTVLTPRSDPARAPRVSTLVDGLDAAQGIAIGRDGDRTVLVVGEETHITSWTYAAGSLSDRRVVVDGLPGGGRHAGKFVALRTDDAGVTTVAYDIGSSTNRDPVDRTMRPERAVIRSVRLDGGGDRLLAVGVRNGEGLSYAPDGTLFAAVNQADEQPAPYAGAGAGYIDEHPNDQVTRIPAGVDLGWPYCVPDSRGHADLTALGFVDDPENNPGGEHLDCTALPPTMLGLPAHSAPIGFVFTRGSALPTALADGALVTAHGSWDRQPPRPPSVSYAAWDPATRTLLPPVPVVAGFQLADGSRWGRSVDAVPGPDGALYVTDDQSGLVYRIAPPS